MITLTVTIITDSNGKTVVESKTTSDSPLPNEVRVSNLLNDVFVANMNHNFPGAEKDFPTNQTESCTKEERDDLDLNRFRNL